MLDYTPGPFIKLPFPFVGELVQRLLGGKAQHVSAPGVQAWRYYHSVGWLAGTQSQANAPFMGKQDFSNFRQDIPVLFMIFFT